MQKQFLRLLKLIVSVVLLWVIYRYFLKIDRWDLIWIEIKKTPFYIFLIALIVSFINWGLEALKWKILMENAEPMPYKKAWKSVYAGSTISNIFPFRIGEYLGRIIYIKTENRIAAVFNSVFGSTAQLAVSLSLGIPAALIMLDKNATQLSHSALVTLAALILVFAALFIISKRLKKVKNRWMDRLIEDIRKFTVLQIFQVIALSVLRYALFSSFYVFLLYFYDISNDLYYLYSGVATIYLLQSFAPSMILTDAGLRTGLPLIVFKIVAGLQPALLAAAIINYGFNIMLPSVIGVYFILVEKIKDKKI